MDKNVVHIHSGTLLSRSKNETVLFAATWMDLERVIPSEVSTEGRVSYDISYLEPRGDSNELTVKTLTDSELTVAAGEG